MWGCVWLDTGKSFKRVGHGKVSIIVIKGIVIIWILLHQVIWLDISAEREGSTYWSKRVSLCWDIGTFNVPMQVHVVWNFRILC